MGRPLFSPRNSLATMDNRQVFHIITRHPWYTMDTSVDWSLQIATRNKCVEVCYIPCARMGHILFCEKKKLVFPNSSLKLISSICSIVIDNIFAMFVGRVFQQTVGIPMGIYCAPLLADLFRYSHETNFVQGFLKRNEKMLARTFNFTFRYILRRLCSSTK